MRTSSTRSNCVAAALSIAAAVCLSSTILLQAFQTAKSAAAAKELAQALDGAKLEAIAAADPAEPGTFVAALYFPGSQILVVSAKYAAPVLLTDKIAKQNYRDVYIDLNSASVAGSKVFVIDTNVDGLVAKPEDGQGADQWEQGKTQVTFDGQWKKAKMSEEEYMKAFATADERYTHILQVLTTQAKGKGTGF
jgi:hypothetical protein